MLRPPSALRPCVSASRGRSCLRRFDRSGTFVADGVNVSRILGIGADMQTEDFAAGLREEEEHEPEGRASASGGEVNQHC